MQYVRTIMGVMMDTFDWRFSLEKDFCFDSSLKPALNKLFADHKKEHGSNLRTAN